MSAAASINRVTLRAPRPVDESFPALGSTVRLIATGPDASAAVERARLETLEYHDRMSRFRPESELSALNADPRHVVPASELLRSAVRAALWSAEVSFGLVDPCLLDALEEVGYAESYVAADAPLLPAGPLRFGHPAAVARWRQIRVDDAAGTITRPPGVRLDLGGSGKGHIADLVTRHFAACRTWVVDAGGDVRVGGFRSVHIAHPLRSHPAARLAVRDCAVATSSVVSRAWERPGGGSGHHLLDPASGQPVRTGLLAVTATAGTTLHAETIAKIALLRGPAAARTLLAGRGGVLVHEGGRAETINAAPEGAA